MDREQEVVTMGEPTEQQRKDAAAEEQFVDVAESGAVLAWQYRRERDEARAQLAALNESLRATSDALMEAQAQLAACREALEDAIPFLDCYPLMGKPLADKARAALAQPEPGGQAGSIRALHGHAAGGSDDG